MRALFRRRLARAGLLLAAALHLLGGGVLADAHAAPPAAESSLLSRGSGDEEAPAPHDARTCAVCLALGSSPMAREDEPAVLVHGGGAAHRDAGAHPPRAHPSLRPAARAPPAAA